MRRHLFRKQTDITAQTEREVDSVSDSSTMRLMQEQYVGFWVIHKYESGKKSGSRHKLMVSSKSSMEQCPVLRKCERGLVVTSIFMSL